MSKVWVLDTETKGTGAQMVPLDKLLRHPEPQPRKRPRRRAKPERPAEAPEPRAPLRFQVVDAMTREVLVEDADAETTLEVLGRLRSVVDVSISVWEPKAERWRPLTLGERQNVWRLRRTD
ncbi:MAG TPA: hypothetical protein VHG69_10725 [Thermoleophilaceae bacterium]|nr:hypothetical protein [Thermoleophilaceae bacterium]